MLEKKNMKEQGESSWTLNHVDIETDIPIEGKSTGEIPDWLEGTLIRNGSGVYRFGKKTVNHLFDGMAVIHRFEISKGRVTYQNRILKSNTYLRSKAADRLMVSQFGTLATPDPCKSTFGKYMSRFQCIEKDLSDNCNVNVYYHGDELYTLGETSKLRRIDPDNLETIGDEVNLTNHIAVNIASAHPHIEEDGTIYNMGNSFGPKGITYNIVKYPPGQLNMDKAEIVSTIPSRWKTQYGYFHSFGITENYFVFIDQPLRLQLLKLLTGKLTNTTIRKSLKYFPGEMARFLVVERKTGKLIQTRYEAPGFMMFHHVNTYERDNQLIIDVCHFTDDTVIGDLIIKKMSSKKEDISPGLYTRFVLPLHIKPPEQKHQYGVNLIKLEGTRCKSFWLNKKVVMCLPDHISPEIIELPRINYQYNGKYYRYVYGIQAVPGSSYITKVVKIDAVTRNSKIWERKGFSVSEPVYVSRPGAEKEDDGCILFSCISHENDKLVMLVILDASTFEERATTQFLARGTVSTDFHGIFAAKDETIHRF